MTGCWGKVQLAVPHWKLAAAVKLMRVCLVGTPRVVRVSGSIVLAATVQSAPPHQTQSGGCAEPSLQAQQSVTPFRCFAMQCRALQIQQWSPARGCNSQAADSWLRHCRRKESGLGTAGELGATESFRFGGCNRSAPPFERRPAAEG